MQLRTLHILCDDDDAAEKVKALAKDCSAAIEQWEVNNTDSVSVYLLVHDQDQALFDALEDLAQEKESIRMIVQPVDASFPKNFQDEQQKKEENKLGFFDIISREEMTEIVSQQARLNGSYLSLVAISSIVATIALIEGNVAILIGSMVLTPLLGPNLALAFSTATTDTDLTKRAICSGGAGFLLTFLVAVLTGFIFSKPAAEDMTSMLVQYGFESIPIAVCAGIAATILLLQGTLSSLIGVMVAVAFLPPIAMTGLALSAADYYDSANALMLFAINLAAFNLAAKTLLLMAGVRPRKSEEGQYSCRTTIVYIVGWLLAVILLALGLHFKS